MNGELYDNLKAEMRMQALENLVCVFAGFVFRVGEKFYPTIFEEFDQEIRRATQSAAMRGFDDPAMSDLSAAEFEESMNRLLGMITRQRMNSEHPG